MSGSTTRTVQVNIVGDSSKLSSAMKKAGDDTQSATGRITSAWSGVAGSIGGAFGGAFEPLMGVLDSFSGKLDGLKQHAGLAIAGIGGAGLAAGTSLQLLGSKEQAAQQQLAQAFDNVGGNIDDYQGRIDKSVGSMTKFGFTGDQVKTALTQLVTATKDPAKSLDLLQTAANLAALKHEDLSTATEQLVKVVSGKGTRTLTELGISMGHTSKSGYDVEAALKAVADRTNGQASAAADTYAGKMKALRAEIENHVSAIGQKYGPALQGLGATVGGIGAAVETYQAITKRASEAEGLAKLAIDAKAVAEVADTAAEGAQAAGETAVAASEGLALAPVLLIIAALAALGVGIYELATHWSTVWNGIKDVVDTVWHGIDDDFIHPVEDFFTGIPKFIEDHWQLILSILTGPIGAAIIWITTHFQTVVDFFTGIPGAIANTFELIGKGIANGVITGINAVIDAWDWLMDHFKIPKVSVLGFSIGGEDLGGPLKLGHVPYLAGGGIVTGPMLAMLGDNRSGKEAVVPLEKAGQFGFGGGQPPIELTLNIDSKAFATATWPAIRSHALQTTARNGRKVGLG